VAQSRPSYHHGDLRAAVLDASLALIESEGIGAVSLRRVARIAGVSPGAPYHHFADRAELLGTLATRGFESLTERLVAAQAGAPDPTVALRAMLDAYLQFASDQPAYFRLMFRPELSQSDKPTADTKAAGHAALEALADAVANYLREWSLPDTLTYSLTMLCWGVGHGLASLQLDGQLDKNIEEFGADASRLIAEVVSLFEALLTSYAS
jgi:AcrR family transcriptional regulator